ncbi:hypothetical protein FCH28_03545 [Streptomyces piniterrae]|uniref:Uncharacterized protein n=1 Tax=Streptomyces piniterrae TaxID=2571125 RepID=A0A4U0NWT1_9ACTN|nr:hypothetical protein [Streptomyces piniterrae]TJZ59183.1 hypothetical protein FCH28_03545 [Streptomyces piniterrae]
MAKLYLDSLTCVTTEDWTDTDEPKIVLEGKGTVWRGKVLDGQTYSVDYACSFTGRIGVILIEVDDPDPDDVLGYKRITDTPGTRTLHFNASGAEYVLTYAVE